MSNNDFFLEEKCVPMKRAAAVKKPAPLPRELKPKFPMEPMPPSPMTPAPAYVAPTPPAPAPPAPALPAPIVTPPPATPPPVEQEKSQNKEDPQANPQIPQQPGNFETPSANGDDVKTADNQENKDPGMAENQNPEGQEPKKKKKPKKEAPKAPRKLEEGAAVAVFIDDDDDAFGPEKPKKKEAPVPGQAVFVDEEEEEKEKESKRKDKKDKKKMEKKDKLGGKNERPGSVRQKKHALPAAFTAFANPGAPNQQGSVFQKKDQGSARNRNKAAQAAKPKNPPKPAAPPAPVAPAPVVKAGREPNEGFFKAMYSKAKTKIVAMSKNPNTPQSSSSSTSTTSSVSISGSDDSLIATDANLALKTEVAAVYGSAADYPRGVLPAKTDKNHPDKLFPGGRPFWLIRDEKPPEAKVILMSLVDQCLRDGTLTLVEPQEKPKELTPYAEDVKPLKAKDEKYVLDASRILANTVYNTCHMKSIAFKALKDAKKPLDKPRIGKLKMIPPTQCAVYNRKQQKQKKFAKSPYKSATGTDAHKAITRKKKSTASTD